MNQDAIYEVVSCRDRSEANWLDDFCFPWLNLPVPETRFRAWHWDGFFRFEFLVGDGDLVLAEGPGMSDDDRVLGSDRVELFFSPTPDLSLPYHGFEMDPRGLVFDYEAAFHRQFDPAWSLSSLETEGKITETGYFLEGSIPMADLREHGWLREREMITGVYRAEFSRDSGGGVAENWISWIDPQTSEPDFHIPETFGRFVFTE